MISVVIPAFNEEAAIAETVQSVRTALEAGGFVEGEIIVVDDGSDDETGCRAEASGARVVRHPHNVGYGRSLKDGIKCAGNDVIVISDADGTYPIASIPRLVEEYQKGFDMVVGARQGNFYQGPMFKRALRVFLKFMVEFTTGRSVPDVNSGLRVFARTTVMPYFPHLSEGFSFTTSMTLAYMMTGRFVTYVPIGYEKRVGKTKVHLVRDSLRTMQFIVQAILYYNPIKIYILICAQCLTAGLAGLALFAALHRAEGLIFAMSMLMLAVLVFSIGLLAVLLKQIMDRSPADAGV